jgi:hypothetical protein
MASPVVWTDEHNLEKAGRLYLHMHLHPKRKNDFNVR